VKRGKAQVWRKVGRILSVSMIAVVPELCAAQSDAPPLAEHLMQTMAAASGLAGLSLAAVALAPERGR